MITLLRALLGISLTLTLISTALAKSPDSVISQLAEHVQAQNRPLRVLFYGQSITKQEWSQDVIKQMREAYPETEIIAENLAVGGFSAPRLLNTTPRDVLLFQPDLIVFHVYGSHGEYEQIMHFIRSRTGAELIIANDHLSSQHDPQKEDKDWTAFINQRFLPAIAEAYGLRLIDLRGQWREHLLENDLPSQALLRDAVHLNDEGNRLMAQIMGRELIEEAHTHELTAVRAEETFNVGDDLQFDEKGELTLPFSGSRIDAVVDPQIAAVFEVRINGEPVSANADNFQATRPLNQEGRDWPWQTGGPVRISSQSAPVAGPFTIEFLTGDIENSTFRVSSQANGDDGEGSTTEDFISKSGQIQIAANHWWTNAQGPDSQPVKPGDRLEYEWKLLGTDTLKSAPGEPAHVILVASLPNEEHTLTLRLLEGNPAALQKLRVIQPPLPVNAPKNAVSSKVSPHGSADSLPSFIFTPL